MKTAAFRTKRIIASLAARPSGTPVRPSIVATEVWKAAKRLQLAQLGLRGRALHVEHFEQGEAALAVAALDRLDRPLRVRKGGSAQHLDLAQCARQRVVGLGQRENERGPAHGSFGLDLRSRFLRLGDVAEILIPDRDRNGGLQPHRIVAFAASSVSRGCAASPARPVRSGIGLSRADRSSASRCARIAVQRISCGLPSIPRSTVWNGGGRPTWLRSPDHVRKIHDAGAHEDRELAPRDRERGARAFAFGAHEIGGKMCARDFRRRRCAGIDAPLQQRRQPVERRDLRVEDLRPCAARRAR